MCFCCCCCRCFGGDKQLLPSCRGLLATREELTTEMEQQLGDALLGHLSALLCSVNDDSNSYKGEREHIAFALIRDAVIVVGMMMI